MDVILHFSPRQFNLDSFWECWYSSLLVNVWKTGHRANQIKKGAGSPISLGRKTCRCYLSLKENWRCRPDSLAVVAPGCGRG